MTDTALTGSVTKELDFHELVAHVKQTFQANSQKIIFTTEQSACAKQVSFNSVYLDTLPNGERDSHNCFTCRDFLKRFSGLVYVSKDGELHSAVWDETNAPEGYGPTVQALREKAEAGKINGRFFSDDDILGTPIKGAIADGELESGAPNVKLWEHFSLDVPEKAKVGVTETVAGLVADYDQRKLKFAESFALFDLALIRTAIHNFTFDVQLATRGGRVEILEQYLKAREAIGTVTGPQRGNLMWYWSARLPGAAALIKTTSLGEYLVMYKQNESLARRRFLEQTAGDVYMRPVKEASEGAINAAEKLIADLGLTSALQRRAAVLSDIPEDKWVWKHPEAVESEPVEAGVFAKLRKQTQEKPNTPVSGGNKDWGDFVQNILPQAKSVMVQVPRMASFGRFITAVDPEAGPILCWDTPEYRNPMSHYVYITKDALGRTVAASHKDQWGLQGEDYVQLLGVVPNPNTWNPEIVTPDLNYGELLVLKGAREVESRGLGLFPQIVTRDLYPVRQVIENHSNTNQLERCEEGEFAGIILSKPFDTTSPVLRLVVELESGVVTFDITRWN